MIQLPNWVTRIGRVGLTDDLPPDRYRCLYATNLACLFHMSSTFPYVVLFSVYRSWLLAGMAMGLCLAYPFSIFLMSHKRYSAARLSMLAAITTAIFIFCLLLGEASRLETTLLYTVAAPAILFSVRETRQMALAVLMPVAAYTLLHAGGYAWFTPYPLTTWQIDLFRVLITATTALLILLPILLLLKAQLDTEQALIAARDKAERSSKAKSEFLATVSHELRTPLNGLLVSLELIEGEPLSGEQRENLSIARSTGNVLKTVIADILDFSRFEKGLITLECKPVSLPELTRRCLAGFKSHADEKDLNLTLQVKGDFPTVLGDSSRLQQIVTNLVGNAIKFTDAGGVTLRLVADGREGDDFRFRIEVEDTGVGIPADKLPGIFEPFTQAHRKSRGDQGGCGLGLSVCSRLAGLMRGSIDATSVEHQGSTFFFRATLAVSPHPAPQGGAEASGMSESQAAVAGRVLLVEDVAVNRLVATKFLHRLGLEVDAAENGRLGVEAYLKRPYDWILMDCQMPVMDGFEATREIRRLALAGEGPPSPVIIALTANAQPEDRVRCFEAGMDAFLEKPLSSDALQATLRRLLVSEPGKTVAKPPYAPA